MLFSGWLFTIFCFKVKVHPIVRGIIYVYSTNYFSMYIYR